MTLDLRSPFALLRRQPDLRRLLWAQLISMTGDWALMIGIGYSVYALTGSTVASAMTLLAGFVPMAVVGLVAGVFVDRWDRKRTMVVTNLLLAVTVLPLMLVGDGDRIWIVYAVMAVGSVLEVFFSPAEQALLPRVVPDDDLVVANGLVAQARNVARLVGAGLGGVIVASGGLSALALIDAASFVLGALLIHRVTVSGRPEPGPVVEADASVVVRGQLATLAHEWRDGFRATWGDRAVRTLVTFTIITCTGEGIMGTLFAPYVRAVLDGTSSEYGLIS